MITREMIAAHAAATGLSLAKAELDLKAKSAEELTALQAIYSPEPVEPTATEDTTPKQVTVLAKVLSVVELPATEQRNELCVATIATPKGKSIAVILTPNQAIGFGVKTNAVLNLTFEKRIENKTTYLDKDSGTVKTHTSTSNGFISAITADKFLYLKETVLDAPAESQAVIAQMLMAFEK